MEEAVHENLLHVRLEEVLGELVAVQINLGERRKARDLLAADVLHRQHARGRVVIDVLRHDDALELAQVVGEGGEVARFEAVVQLAQDVLAELLQERRELVLAARLRVRVEEGGDVAEDVEVFRHLLADAGALHLDDHVAAVAHQRAVNLSERGGGHGRRVELGERLRDAHAQLGVDDLLDLGERERLNLVLEARERVNVGLRQEVCARGHELRELDEGRPQLLDVGGHLLHLGGRDLPVRRALDGRVQARALDEVRAPVPHQEQGDVLVALQVFGLERNRHPVAPARSLQRATFLRWGPTAQ